MDSLDQGLCGSLGHGDGQARSTPTRIDIEAFEGTAAVMVACGDHHTMVVTIATGGGDDLAHYARCWVLSCRCTGRRRDWVDMGDNRH